MVSIYFILFFLSLKNNVALFGLSTGDCFHLLFFFFQFCSIFDLRKEGVGVLLWVSLNCRSCCLIFNHHRLQFVPLQVCNLVWDVDADRRDEWDGGSRWSDKEGRGHGRAGRETGDEKCVQAEASDLAFFNFIPADRCLAGRSSTFRGKRGGLEVGGKEDDLQTGSKEVTLFLIYLPPSLLHWSGNDRFHSSFWLLEKRQCLISRVVLEEVMQNWDQKCSSVEFKPEQNLKILWQISPQLFNCIPKTYLKYNIFPHPIQIISLNFGDLSVRNSGRDYFITVTFMAWNKSFATWCGYGKILFCSLTVTVGCLAGWVGRVGGAGWWGLRVRTGYNQHSHG